MDASEALDVMGYMIQFCSVEVAVRFSLVCKVFSGKFVWGHIRQFDTTYIESSERASLLARKLLEHADDLKMLDSIIVATKSRGDGLVALLLRFVPQLRRLERNIFSIYVEDSDTMFRTMNAQNLEVASIEAFDTAQVIQMFSSKPFPKLTFLAISEEEPEGDDEDNDLRELSPFDMPPGFKSVRPLLDVIAANACPLEHLRLAVSFFKGPDGLIMDAIKALVTAKRATFKTLDFGCGYDISELKSSLPSGHRTLNALNEVLGNSILDSSQWERLPALIESLFGIDISRFRIFAATLWQRMMIYFIAEKCILVPLEHSQALFRAIYDNNKISVVDRINSFQIFLDATVSIDTEHTFKHQTELWEQYRQWITQQILSDLKSLDLSSIPLKSIILGILGVMSFYMAGNAQLDELYDQVIRFGAVHNPTRPLQPYFEALSMRYELECYVPTSSVLRCLLHHRRDQTFDMSAPAKGRPLILHFRDDPKLFSIISHDAYSLFNPLEMHPELGVPLLALILFQPTSEVSHRVENYTLYAKGIFEVLKRTGAVQAADSTSPSSQVLLWFAQLAVPFDIWFRFFTTNVFGKWGSSKYVTEMMKDCAAVTGVTDFHRALSEAWAATSAPNQ